MRKTKSKAEEIIRLIDQRNKLMAEYAAHKRVRFKLECDLDRLTSKIAQLTGLEPTSYAAGGWFDPLKGARVRASAPDSNKKSALKVV